jgi:hypothetical protein
MTAEIEQLFHTLTDLSPDARAQYLAEHGIDGETRREVEALLAFDSGSSAFLAREISIAAGRALPQLNGKGCRCGPYRLLSTVGRGGMGTVYLAERADGEVSQRAAVKLLAPGAGEIRTSVSCRKDRSWLRFRIRISRACWTPGIWRAASHSWQWSTWMANPSMCSPPI